MNTQHRAFLNETLLPIAGATAIALASMWGPSAHAATAPTYGGQAAVIQADISLLGNGLSAVGPIQVNVVSAGPLPKFGGTVTNSLANIGASTLQQVLVGGQIASASTAGGPGSVPGAGATRSKAAVSKVRVGVGVLLPTITVTADVITSEANAKCGTNGQALLSGKSTVTRLAVNGINVPVTGAPNQAVRVSPIAALIINEQKPEMRTGGGTMTANAIRLKLLEPGELIDAEVAVGVQLPSLLKLSLQVLADISLGKLVTGDVLVGHSQAAVQCSGV